MTLEVRTVPADIPEVDALLDAYLDAFGRFYIHSDREALHLLGEHLRADSRFAPLLAADDPDAVERLVRRPPRALERPLLERLDDPEHVGCGHLRSTLLHPEEYGARRELTEALLRAVFVRLWRGDAIDFVVLEGEHREVAVLTVTLDREVAHLKDDLMPRYASLIYNGYWWSPERRTLQHLIHCCQGDERPECPILEELAR